MMNKLSTAFLTGMATCVMLGATSSVSAASATRSIQDQAGEITVEVQVQPDAGTQAYAIEEQLPVNVIGRTISSGGTFDEHSGKIKWGPFPDAQSRTLTYQLLALESTNANINGVVNFNGTETTVVEGNSQTALEANSFDSWIISKLGVDAFNRPESDLNYNGEGDLFPTFVEYYFGLDPDAVDTYPINFELDEQSDKVSISFTRQKDAPEFTLQLEETQIPVSWKILEGDPDQPIILDIGGGFERVEYLVPAEQIVRIVRFTLEVAP